MKISKRIIFILLLFSAHTFLKANDSLIKKKYVFSISTGISHFELNDKNELKYYDGNYIGSFISLGYERKYFITELKYQYGRSRDAVYHFGEWNFGVKIDFLKRHRFSLMTGLYAYRTQNKIDIFLENMPVYDLTYIYSQINIVPVGHRDINYSFYQGGSNFMIMDISNGKFRWAGTNLFYLLWMHLKAEYSCKITSKLNLSVFGCTYFSNSIDRYVSLYTLEKMMSEQRRYYEFMPTKYILNKDKDGLPVFENASSYKTSYFVPNNILLNVGLCIKYHF